jgi:phosphate transport system permease protein
VIMSANSKDATSRVTAGSRQRPLFVTAIAILLMVVAVAAIVSGILLSMPSEGGALSSLQTRLGVRLEEVAPSIVQTLLAAVIVAAVGALLARGLWRLQNWARTAVILLLVAVGLYYGLTVVFDAAAEIFGGEQVVPVGTILSITFKALLRLVATGFVPVAMIYGLNRLGAYFYESPGQRAFMDRGVRYILLATALSSIFIVFLIIVFTVLESREAIEEIGLRTMLLGTVWRPGSIIGTEEAQFGLIPMIIGSILATFGSVMLGVPLSIGTAILLAEVAPPSVREIVRPAVELLAGIPSVVYGLFGMVVLAPLIRKIQIPYNTGFGLLNASIVLAVMIIPTVTNIAEDALRAVPKRYKEGSLALGATHWQTILRVLLPAARSGIVAAVILGIGRALGETMAMIMVIGNSIAIPSPLNDNPLTLFLSTARTLTGNIAVEINYAAGAHRSALFFTGVLLFVMILLINSLARYLMRERLAS